MRYFVTAFGRTFPVELRESTPGTPGKYVVHLNGRELDVCVEGEHVLVDGRVVSCTLDERLGVAHFREGSTPASVTTTDPATVRAARATLRPELRAPMPGKVVELRVAEGDRVEAGQCVAVIEAMKMQNELGAPCAARVTRVHVAPGRTVEANALLLELEPLGDVSAEA